MRSISMGWFMGLCLSLAACSGANPADGEAADPAQPTPSGTSDGTAAPASAAAAGQDSAQDALDDAPPAAPNAPPVDGDAGSPTPDGSAAGAQDAGANDGGRQQIPMPKYGQLKASASTGEMCQFEVNGVGKGSATSLSLTLPTGDSTVKCTRTDGSAASTSVTIVASQTSTVVLPFAAPVPPPGPGEIIAVAIGGTCGFLVNGSPKGTASQLKLSVPAGVYSVGCKPSSGGATMTKTVIVKSDESAMAMFKLQ
jgi:eukaryotic-like serine/threonine-protein kinase